MDDELMEREYKCKKCKKQFVVDCKINEPILKKHDCGGELITVFGKPSFLIFNSPRTGAISRRFA